MLSYAAFRGMSQANSLELPRLTGLGSVAWTPQNSMHRHLPARRMGGNDGCLEGDGTYALRTSSERNYIGHPDRSQEAIFKIP